LSRAAKAKFEGALNIVVSTRRDNEDAFFQVLYLLTIVVIIFAPLLIFQQGFMTESFQSLICVDVSGAAASDHSRAA
jgi:hypothetical protein